MHIIKALNRLLFTADASHLAYNANFSLCLSQQINKYKTYTYIYIYIYLPVCMYVYIYIYIYTC